MSQDLKKPGNRSAFLQPPPYQQQAQQALIVCTHQANLRLKQNFHVPVLSFNQRGKAAGSALLEKYQIKLNPILLEDNLETFLSEIIPHELCHLLAYQLYGRVKPHGIEWQSLMRNVFGLKPTTTHQINIDKVRGKTFRYQCACRSVNLSTIRHNRIQRKQQQYRCRECGEILRQVL